MSSLDFLLKAEVLRAMGARKDWERAHNFVASIPVIGLIAVADLAVLALLLALYAAIRWTDTLYRAFMIIDLALLVLIIGSHLLFRRQHTVSPPTPFSMAKPALRFASVAAVMAAALSNGLALWAVVAQERAR
jgi:hypothetical protein